MATAKAGYYANDGRRLPSVTTVLSRFKDSGALIGWAHKLGLKGVDYRGVANDEAAVGTAVHEYAEALPGEVPAATLARVAEFAEEHRFSYDRATKAVDAWRESARLDIQAREVPLVSETLRYGGTLDAIAGTSGWGYDEVVDYKSSKRIYADAIVQVAAYRALWNENNQEKPVRYGRIVRFDKGTGDFEELLLSPETLDEAFELFVLYREAYDLVKRVEKHVK